MIRIATHMADAMYPSKKKSLMYILIQTFEGLSVLKEKPFIIVL